MISKIAITLALCGAFLLNGCLSAQEKKHREHGKEIAETVIEAVTEL